MQSTGGVLFEGSFLQVDFKGNQGKFGGCPYFETPLTLTTTRGALFYRKPLGLRSADRIIPTPFIASWLAENQSSLPWHVPLVCCSKGIEQETWICQFLLGTLCGVGLKGSHREIISFMGAFLRWLKGKQRAHHRFLGVPPF